MGLILWGMGKYKVLRACGPQDDSASLMKYEAACHPERSEGSNLRVPWFPPAKAGG